MHRETTPVEVIVTYISMGWAYVFLSGHHVFGRSENFDKIQSLAGKESVIGMIALVCALVKLAGLAFDKARLRWFGLVLSSVFWIVMASAFLIAKDHIEINTPFIVYSGIAVLSLWTSKEVIQNDRAKRGRTG